MSATYWTDLDAFKGVPRPRLTGPYRLDWLARRSYPLWLAPMWAWEWVSHWVSAFLDRHITAAPEKYRITTAELDPYWVEQYVQERTTERVLHLYDEFTRERRAS